MNTQKHHKHIVMNILSGFNCGKVFVRKELYSSVVQSCIQLLTSLLGVQIPSFHKDNSQVSLITHLDN